ncbi:MAG: DUF4249 domain-containing protein [Flavobacteriaceae bacterium]|nr:DUF4249 domain-containing protein [Flavobacteriaceae bacterium]
MLCSVLMLSSSCVEEFIPENLSFESLLVVEASVTDEFKNHEIRLSRTFKFNDDSLFETGAQVSIIDEFQNVNNFIELEPGTYVSANEFAIQPNINYRLSIMTKDNSSYESLPMTLPNSSGGITDVTYTRSINADNVVGIEILVDSFDPTGNSNYYRFEIEETYRIVPPWYRVLEIIVISDTPPFEVATQPRSQEERECFNTLYSTGILQTQTNGFSEDRITKFPLKFIPADTTIIRDRYSILVKQFVQSLEAYTYFNTLNDFSNSESVFSENQPGFLNGNIFSKTNSDEKVIGFFEIASMTSKRIFFNYGDVFPDLTRPPFFAECTDFETPFLSDPSDPSTSPLIEKVKNNEIEYVEDNTDFFGNIIENQPFVVINRECGDCTVFGSNIKPDFWID